MAIVKMKKLRLAVMASERKALLRDLLLLGCVEVSEPDELESGQFDSLRRCTSPELGEDRADLAAFTDAIRLMDKYAPAKGGGLLSPLPQAKLASLLDEQPLQADKAIAEKVIGKEEEIKRAASETARLEAEIAALAPWLDLDVPLSAKAPSGLFSPPRPCLRRRIWQRWTQRSEPRPRNRSSFVYPATSRSTMSL